MMRVSSAGWGFFGLAVAVCLVYFLNRGVYVGYVVVQAPPLPDGRAYSWKFCKYFHFTGISTVPVASDLDRNIAEASFCPPLKNSN